jgi:hypothetical protein
MIAFIDHLYTQPLTTCNYSATADLKLYNSLVWLSFGPSGGDVGPGHSHVLTGVHSHESWVVTGPALYDQARFGPFHNDSQRVMGGFNIFAGVCPFPPATNRFPTSDHPSCPSRGH